MIEQLVKSSVLDLLLILHLDLQHLPLIHVCVPNHVLAQVDRRYRIVHFQHLCQNEQILAVQALLPQIELHESVHANLAHRDLPTVHTDSLDVVLVNELGQVFETESVNYFLLVAAARGSSFMHSEVHVLVLINLGVQLLIGQDRVSQHLSH